jgi:hypothetical protein
MLIFRQKPHLVANLLHFDLGVEDIDLPPLYKWKIAFHYQNLKDVSIVPIFTKEALIEFLTISGDYAEHTWGEHY